MTNCYENCYDGNRPVSNLSVFPQVTRGAASRNRTGDLRITSVRNGCAAPFGAVRLHRSAKPLLLP
jgi:hypothetical protein